MKPSYSLSEQAKASTLVVPSFRADLGQFDLVRVLSTDSANLVCRGIRVAILQPRPVTRVDARKTRALIRRVQEPLAGAFGPDRCAPEGYQGSSAGLERRWRFVSKRRSSVDELVNRRDRGCNQADGAFDV